MAKISQPAQKVTGWERKATLLEFHVSRANYEIGTMPKR